MSTPLLYAGLSAMEPSPTCDKGYWEALDCSAAGVKFSCNAWPASSPCSPCTPQRLQLHVHVDGITSQACTSCAAVARRNPE